MHKIQVMAPELGPPKCLGCGRGNTPDDGDTLDDFWVLDLERDYNWGDPAYLCKYCCRVVAGESGYAPADQIDLLAATIEQKNTEIHDLEARLDAVQQRVQRVLEGKKAERQLKSKKKVA
jgi:hypothetical protein